jgi:hypothetical protein
MIYQKHPQSIDIVLCIVLVPELAYLPIARTNVHPHSLGYNVFSLYVLFSSIARQLCTFMLNVMELVSHALAIDWELGLRREVEGFAWLFMAVTVQHRAVSSLP